jgi:hypothetical protein
VTFLAVLAALVVYDLLKLVVRLLVLVCAAVVVLPVMALAVLAGGITRIARDPAVR